MILIMMVMFITTMTTKIRREKEMMMLMVVVMMTMLSMMMMMLNVAAVVLRMLTTKIAFTTAFEGLVGSIYCMQNLELDPFGVTSLLIYSVVFFGMVRLPLLFEGSSVWLLKSAGPL